MYYFISYTVTPFIDISSPFSNSDFTLNFSNGLQQGSPTLVVEKPNPAGFIGLYIING
ncbi:UNVERIFIED_CONTAM: hypothetical protein FKN15_005784 [Acipenser sinensis]